MIPLPDAPAFTYEPGRGFVVTAGTTPRPRPPILLSTTASPVRTIEGPSVATTTTTTTSTTARFAPGSEVGSISGPPISGTTKAVEETSRFFPSTQRTGSIDIDDAAGAGGVQGREQGGDQGIGQVGDQGRNQTVDQSTNQGQGRGFGQGNGTESWNQTRDRDRSIDVAQISDNVFPDSASSSSLRDQYYKTDFALTQLPYHYG